MADGSFGSLGSASVEILADQSNFDQAIDSLPARSAGKLANAARAIQAKLAATRLELKPLGDDSTYRLVPEQAKYEALTKTQAQLEAKLAAVRAAALKQEASLRSLATTSVTTSAASLRLGNASNVVVASMGNNRHATRNAGFALLEFSRAMEDAQYGLRGIQNNIPGLVMAMGGSAGLAGAASVLIVAAGQVYEHWDQIAKLWRSDETTKEAERMKALADATKEAAAATERLKKFQGERVDRNASAIEAAVKETGYQRSIKDLVTAMHNTRKGAGLSNKDAEQFAKDMLGKAVTGDAKEIQNVLNLMARGPDTKSRLGKALLDPGGHQAERDREEARAHASAIRQTQMDEVRKETEELDRAGEEAARNLFSRYAKGLIRGGADTKEGRADLESRINKDLVDSGMEVERAKSIATRVIDAMLDQADKDIEVKAQTKGISRDAARAKVVADLDEKAKQARLAEIKEHSGSTSSGPMSIQQYMDRLQSGHLKDDTSAPIVREQRTSNQILADIRTKIEMMAVPKNPNKWSTITAKF